MKAEVKIPKGWRLLSGDCDLKENDRFLDIENNQAQWLKVIYLGPLHPCEFVIRKIERKRERRKV